jgi:K+-sensing histidine kinase KdpD
MTLVPSGSRYLIIAQLFALAVIIIYYSDYIYDLYNKWLIYLIPVFVFFIVVSVRVALDSTSVMTVFANPLVVSFIDLPIPLLSIFK